MPGAVAQPAGEDDVTVFPRDSRPGRLERSGLFSCRPQRRKPMSATDDLHRQPGVRPDLRSRRAGPFTRAPPGHRDLHGRPDPALPGVRAPGGRRACDPEPGGPRPRRAPVPDHFAAPPGHPQGGGGASHRLRDAHGQQPRDSGPRSRRTSGRTPGSSTSCRSPTWRAAWGGHRVPPGHAGARSGDPVSGIVVRRAERTADRGAPGGRSRR